MKKIGLFLSAVFLSLLFTSCDKTPPLPPSDPIIPNCEKYHTAEVRFKNRSVSNKTMSIVWDGNIIATIPPFQDSQVFTVPSGSHTLVFKASNSGAILCSQSNPVVVECHDQEFTCSS